MSRNVVSKPLPHQVGTADIASPELKRVAMLFMENFKSLDARLSAVEKAINDDQKKGG